MMKTKYFTLLFCALCTLGLTFQSCDDDDDDIRVGVCLKNPSNSWRSSLRKHAVNSLEEFGLTYSIGTSVNQERQAELITSMVNRGCEALIVSPEGEPKEALEAAVNAEIPVIFTESAPIATYAVLVEIDNAKIGESAAGFFNKQENISKIALFKINQDIPASEGRINGIKSKLNSNLEIIEIELDVYTAAAGKSAMTDILTNYPDVDAVYAQDDEVALGAYSAIIESDQIKAIVGCGGSTEYLSEIKKSVNISLATTLYSPKALMAAAVEEAYLIVEKGNTPTNKKVSLESELVDKTNVDEHIRNPAY